MHVNVVILNLCLLLTPLTPLGSLQMDIVTMILKELGIVILKKTCTLLVCELGVDIQDILVLVCSELGLNWNGCTSHVVSCDIVHGSHLPIKATLLGPSITGTSVVQ